MGQNNSTHVLKGDMFLKLSCIIECLKINNKGGNGDCVFCALLELKTVLMCFEVSKELIRIMAYTL